MTPDSPLGFEDLERAPERAAADADLCRQDPLRWKSLVGREETLVKEGSQLPQSKVGAVRKRLGMGHSGAADDPICHWFAEF
jgi:hypothetical protein